MDYAIRVEQLSFSYPGSREQTLTDLSFSVQPATVYGFLGPSGAGKSTTQKILYGLLGGYRGSARISGTEVSRWGAQLYTRTGIGFETPNLYLKLTGRENLEFALALHEAASRRGRRGSAPDRSSLQNIDHAAERLGLRDALDTRIETWSKGMRMRLAFIRAVLHQPEILFLDEPTSGLDPMWARAVKDWIAEVREAGAAVFLTTHSMELADEVCDTVGFLVDGHIVAEGAPTDLRQRLGRRAIKVQGADRHGVAREAEYAYDELLSHAIEGFARIDRITNREVTLEQVFLALTGRSLRNGTPTGAQAVEVGPRAGGDGTSPPCSSSSSESLS
jgi:fluoroquinolone transport system ATP-binding protein